MAKKIFENYVSYRQEHSNLYLENMPYYKTWVKPEHILHFHLNVKAFVRCFIFYAVSVVRRLLRLTKLNVPNRLLGIFFEYYFFDYSSIIIRVFLFEYFYSSIIIRVFLFEHYNPSIFIRVLLIEYFYSSIFIRVLFLGTFFEYFRLLVWAKNSSGAYL